jgi:hypothetical protein
MGAGTRLVSSSSTLRSGEFSRVISIGGTTMAVRVPFSRTTFVGLMTTVGEESILAPREGS